MENNCLIHVILILACVAVALASNAPSSSRITVKGRRKQNKNRRENQDLIKHYLKGKEEITLKDPTHQTRSDAMQLYSISAKKIIEYKDKNSNAQYWDEDIVVAALKVTSTRKNHNVNKFVTETVAYGRLKIRSVEGKRYICAKNNGEIIFKVNGGGAEKVGERSSWHMRMRSAERKGNNKIYRKRCLFNWSFTHQMHIKLSVETAGGVTWFLTVKNDIVSLTHEKGSSELERSFIWLPAQSTTKSTTPTSKRKRHVSRHNQRSFPLAASAVKPKLSECGNMKAKYYMQEAKLKYLKRQVRKLNKQLRR